MYILPFWTILPGHVGLLGRHKHAFNVLIQVLAWTPLREWWRPSVYPTYLNINGEMSCLFCWPLFPHSPYCDLYYCRDKIWAGEGGDTEQTQQQIRRREAWFSRCSHVWINHASCVPTDMLVPPTARKGVTATCPVEHGWAYPVTVYRYTSGIKRAKITSPREPYVWIP